MGVSASATAPTVNGSGTVVIQESNPNLVGAITVNKASTLIIQTGGAATASLAEPLGAGNTIEVFGTLTAQGPTGSFYNAASSANADTVILRPGGVLKFDNSAGNFTGSGGQGRWSDSVSLALNGGTVSLTGATNLDSSETIGAVTVNQAATINLAQAGTGTATLSVASLTRGAGGTLYITTTGTGTTNSLNAPSAYNRFTAGALNSSPATTNTNGMAPAWIVNQTDNTFVSYVSATNGYTDLGSAVGQVPYSQISASGTISGTTSATTLDISGSSAIGTATVYAMRVDSGVNVTNSGTTPTVTVVSGGIIGNTTGTISPILQFGATGTTEALIYSAGVNLVLAGGLETTGGATFFGAGGISLTETSGGQGVFGGAASGVVLSGNVYINTTANTAYTTGNVFVGAQFSLGGSVNLNAANPLNNGSTITLNHGDLSLNLTNTYFPNDVVVAGDAAVGENGTTGTAANNLTFSALSGGTGSPVILTTTVLSANVPTGSSTITFFGNLTLNGPAIINTVSNNSQTIPLVIQGGIVSASNAAFTKDGNQLMTIIGNAPSYTGSVTVNQGVLATQDGSTTLGTPFGTGTITVNPGASLRIASEQNVTGATSVAINSDGAGIGVLGLAYVGPVTTAAGKFGAGGYTHLSFNSNGGPIAGAIGIDVTGFSTALDETLISNNLAGGQIVYLGSTLGGSYTATTLGAGANNTFYLGFGGSSLQINSQVLSDLNPENTNPLVKASVVFNAVSNGAAGTSIGLINAGSTVFLNTPQSYTGGTTVNATGVQVDNNNGLGSGLVTMNGGLIDTDAVGKNTAGLVAARVIPNNIAFVGGVQATTYDMDVNVHGSNDVFFTGKIILSGNGTSLTDGVGNGTVRTINIAQDGSTSFGTVTFSGVISDNNGVSSTQGIGDTLTKIGNGFLMLTGTSNSYTGFTNINGGEIVVTSDSNIPTSSAITMNGGALGVWSLPLASGGVFTTNRNYTLFSTSATVGAATFGGGFDIGPGINFIESATSNINGSGNLIKTGSGVMVLNGANSFNAVAIDMGVLSVSNNANLGDTVINGAINFANTTVSGTGIAGAAPFLNPASTLLVTSSFATSRLVTIAANTFGTIDVASGQTFGVSGVISGATAGGSELTKTGLGTLFVSGTNTLTTLNIAGGGTFAASPATTTAVPWATTANININGGVLSLFQPPSPIGGGVSQSDININAVAGNITYNGAAYVSLQDAPDNATQLTTTNLFREPQGTLVIQAVNSDLGVTGIRGEDFFASVINGYSTGFQLSSINVNGIVAPNIVMADSSGNANFVQYGTQAQGFIPIPTGIAVANFTGGLNSVVDVTGLGAQSLGGLTANIYAVRTDSDITNGTLRIQSTSNTTMGALLLNGANDTVSANLVFGDAMVPSGWPTVANGSATGEGLVYVKTAATISGNVTSNGFTKFGPGALSVSGTSNGILGSFAVQQGTVTFAGAASTTAQMGLVLNDTATLDLAGQNIDFGSLNNLGNTGGGIVTNSGTGTNTLIINGTAAGVNFSTGPAARLGTFGQNTLAITNLPTTADLYVGEPVSGTNIAAGAVIQSITNSTAIVLAANTSTNNANVTPVSELISFSTLTNVFNGQIVDGNGGLGKVALEKSGTGTLELGQLNQAFTNSGNNTFSGGTTVAQGTLRVDNVFGLGGYNGSTPGAVNLYGGILDLRSNGAESDGTIIFGNQSTGLTVNAFGPTTINTDRVTSTFVNQLDGAVGDVNVGNAIQIVTLNIGQQILTMTGADSYRLKVSGTTNLNGLYATFSPTSAAPDVLELAGVIQDGGAGTGLSKTGTGTLVISGNNTSTYSGGTNILAGALQVTSTSGQPLGTGAVTIAPGAVLRVGGANSLSGTAGLTTLSVISSLGEMAVDSDSFDPALVYGSGITMSVYGAALELGTTQYNQVINMATVGNGNTILGATGITASYLAPTLGAGAGGVYRLGGGGTLDFTGSDNVLTGSATSGPTVIVGSLLNNINGSGIAGANGTVQIFNSNNYTGGTEITKGATVQTFNGGSATGANTPLGAIGNFVDVFGTYQIEGATGTVVNQTTTTQNDYNIILRPGGIILVDDNTSSHYTGAGDNGRWSDSVGLDLNGGTFRYNGNANLNSLETVGTFNAGKGGTINVTRNTGAGSAELILSGLTRTTDNGTTLANSTSGLSLNVAGEVGNGTLAITTSAATTLGLPNAQAVSSYDRLLVTGFTTASGNVAGGEILTYAPTLAATAPVTNQMAPVWIVNATDNSYVSYQSGSGYQSILAGNLGSGVVLNVGQLQYNTAYSTAAGTFTATSAGTQTVDVSAAYTLAAGNNTLWSLRDNGNIAISATANALTLDSGGLLFNGTSIIGPAAATAAVPLTGAVTFGATGTTEAVIFAGAALRARSISTW